MPDLMYGANILGAGNMRPPTIAQVDAMDKDTQGWTYQQIAFWIKLHEGRLDLLLAAAETTADPEWTKAVLEEAWNSAPDPAPVAGPAFKPMSQRLGSR